jgi:hypothetical protein
MRFIEVEGHLKRSILKWSVVDGFFQILFFGAAFFLGNAVVNPIADLMGINAGVIAFNAVGGLGVGT